MDAFIHPTAIVDEGAEIAPGTKVWHFCHVMAGAAIGPGCNLGQNVFVGAGVRIGRNCKIQNNVSVYEGVTLEDDVFCGPSVVFTNVKHPRSEIVRRGQYEPTHVGRGATLGANSTIVCGSRIGPYAFIAAGAVVAGDVPPYALMAGVPARRIGWSGRAGYRLEPAPDRDGLFICPSTGEQYRQEDEQTLTPLGEPQDAPSANPASENRDDRIPMVDLKAQYATIAREAEAAMRRVAESQQFILGAEVQAFEEEAARAIGTPHAIGCASGSDALLLALMALDLPPGSEVITTPYTFFATVGAIVRLGLRPVFCDIEPLTFNLNPALLDQLVTPRTRAVIPVHLFGQCAEMEPILGLAARHGLAVVEDAAQAIGARWQGRAAGTIGAVGCFSFFPSKNLGGFGDGGLMTTADDTLATRLRALRVHGSAKRYIHEWVGINSRLDALQAAILRVKLPRLAGWTDAREQVARRYTDLFQAAGLVAESGSPADLPLDRVILPAVRAERHVYNQYVMRVHESRRDGLREHLRARGIDTMVYYPMPLHLQPCLKEYGWKEGDLPEAECASRQTIALPMHPELTPARQRRIVEAIAAFR